MFALLKIPSARLFGLDEKGSCIGFIRAEGIAQVARLRFDKVGFPLVSAGKAIEIPQGIAINLAGDCFDCLTASEKGSADSDRDCLLFHSVEMVKDQLREGRISRKGIPSTSREISSSYPMSRISETLARGA
jgi:hypothetical protein